jgi:hypothetical protein
MNVERALGLLILVVVVLFVLWFLVHLAGGMA